MCAYCTALLPHVLSAAPVSYYRHVEPALIGTYDPFKSLKIVHGLYLSASQRYIKRSMLPIVPKNLPVFWQHRCDGVRVTEVHRPHSDRHIQVGQLGTTHSNQCM